MLAKLIATMEHFFHTRLLSLVFTFAGLTWQALGLQTTVVTEQIGSIAISITCKLWS